jgi:phenylacetate-CoA ligase
LQPIDDLARAARSFAPDVLAGYPGVLTEIAGVWPGMRAPSPNPRLVITGGETLTPAMRARIGRGFHAPVINFYGSHEVNLLGWECAVSGDFHVCDDNVVVEILRNGRPVEMGESGDVVITALHGYAAPYIRYDLGDVATRGDASCRCGAPFSTIRNLHGRRMDYCVLPDGRRMHHWELIPMTFWDMPWHRRYQLVQETHQRLVLRVVADDRVPEGDLARLSSAIREKLGPGVKFRIDLVDDLAFSATGKHQLCRSEVAALSPTPKARGSAQSATSRSKVEFRELGIGDLAALARLRDEILARLPHPHDYIRHGDEEEFLRAHLGVAGICLGIDVGEELVGFSALSLDVQAAHLDGELLAAIAARCTPLQQICVLAVTMVHPAFRGMGLHRQSIELRLDMARARGRVEAVTMASPSNTPSLCNLVGGGGRVEGIVDFPDGRVRYLVSIKTGREPSAATEASTLVPVTDVARVRPLLAQGYAGEEIVFSGGLAHLRLTQPARSQR